MSRAAALEAINKATVETDTGGQLNDSQSAAFLQVIKDKGTLSPMIRQEIRRSATGELNKISSGNRLIRGAVENSDDGYRAGVTFPTVPYTAKKIRLPFEVTEDFYRHNIEEQAAEAKIVDEMTSQFSLDLEDLDVNGDESSGNAFIQIDDGLIALCEASSTVHKVDGSAINGGAFDKDHLFAGRKALPNKYANSGNAKWLMSPLKKIEWVEGLTDRNTAAGDAALLGLQGDSPLAIDIVAVPSFPDDVVILTDPKNLARVLTWDVRKKKVTGDTDWELATRDKRGYIYFIERDFIIEEDDAVVYIHDLDV